MKSFLNRADLPLGLRNNNPGNLRPGIAWQGVTGENGGFLVFENIAMGIRALATDVGNDIRMDGSNTLISLVYEYAPPSENDTQRYLSRMVALTGFQADQVIPVSAYNLAKLIRGFITVEVGDSYTGLVTDADIQEGLSLVNEDLRSYFGIGQADQGGGGHVGLLIGAVVVGVFFLVEL